MSVEAILSIVDTVGINCAALKFALEKITSKDSKHHKYYQNYHSYIEDRT